MTEFSLKQNWWQFLIIAIVCYLVGSFNAARIIARSKHKDITKMGSGNPGTMNMSREFGLKVGAFTFLCDAIKGGVPALIGHLIYRDFVFSGTAFAVSDFIRYFCGVFVIVGHIFPIWQKFKGGKGIASTLGLFWFSLSCENLWWILVGFGVAAIIIGFIYFTEWGSLASLLGVTGCSIAQLIVFLLTYGYMHFNAYMVGAFICLFVLNLLTWGAHRKNIVRLLAGEEHRTSIKEKLKKKKERTV